MKALGIATLMFFVAAPVALAGDVILDINDAALSGSATFDLGEAGGLAKVTLRIFTELTLDGEDDPNTGINGFMIPGVFSDLGEKIGNVTWDNTDHGNTYMMTMTGTQCGPELDDYVADGGSIGVLIASFGSTGPNINPNLWQPGSTGGLTSWGRIVAKVNTNVPGTYRVSLDPTGLADPGCSFDPNAVVNAIHPPWIPDNPGDPFPLNAAGHYQVDTVAFPPLGSGFTIHVYPEPLSILLLAPATLLLRKRRRANR